MPNLLQFDCVPETEASNVTNPNGGDQPQEDQSPQNLDQEMNGVGGETGNWLRLPANKAFTFYCCVTSRSALMSKCTDPQF